LHGDAFALNSFLSGLPGYVMACLPFKDGRPQGWGELMPDATSSFIWALERGKTIKFL
jgi:hypothetical protein